MTIPSLKKINQKLQFGIGQKGTVMRDLKFITPISFLLVIKKLN
jgi:hypothetical protein